MKASETDTFRKGMMVYLGSTGDELCPVVSSGCLISTNRAPGPFLSLGVLLSRMVHVCRMTEVLWSVGVDVVYWSRTIALGLGQLFNGCGDQATRHRRTELLSVIINHIHVDHMHRVRLLVRLLHKKIYEHLGLWWQNLIGWN